MLNNNVKNFLDIILTTAATFIICNAVGNSFGNSLVRRIERRGENNDEEN